MLDIKFIENNVDAVKEALKNRNFAELHLIDELISLNTKRKNLLTESENKRAQQKARSKEMPLVMRNGTPEEKEAIKQELKQLSDEGKNFGPLVKKVEDEINEILMNIPNVVSENAPVGANETENVVTRSWGEKPAFDFDPQNHWDIIKEGFGLERGVKLSGARFSCYSGDIAKLERAVINYMLDTADKNGYNEIVPPVLVSRESMTASGQLPKFEDDAFKTTDDMFLIPTAEVSLVNLHREEIVEHKNLPLRYSAYTPCFRKEAGSYGKDTRGIIRLHQFHKVELVVLAKPENSTAEHERMVNSAEDILKGLNLHYQVLDLCTGDLGFNALRTFDLEVWLPGQNAYREISSISTTGAFQARRASLRFRDESGKPQFLHALNGSGMAVDRTMVAIIENYQNSDGTITVPEVLKPYLGGRESLN